MNPFKEYVRRRNGKVGQRFIAAIVPVGFETAAYDGEVMLAGWADTEKGKTVKFWLDEEAERHPFAGYDKRTTKPGSLFMGAFRLLNDDQSDGDVTHEAETGQQGRRLSSQIHLMVTSPLFCQFLTERSKKTENLQSQGLRWDSMHNGEMMSKAYVKKVLGIESLSDLDRDATKAQEFHDVFRKRFAKWSGGDSR